MNKIIDKIVEPSHIEVGSIFKLKIKAIRYMSYEEMKVRKVSTIKQYTVAILKGD